MPERAPAPDAVPVADRAPWATPLLAASLHRSVRRDLGGVWVRGPLPPAGAGAGGAVLAPSHGSWWDGYVMREVTLWAGADFRVLMTGRQLGRFPFLRRIGALGTGEVRAAVRWAQKGSWVVVFPEGAVQPPGPLGQVQPGAAWMARSARVPLVPVALRVILRGGQRPEAYLRFGPPVSEAELPGALAHELSRLDDDLRGSDPEQPLAGYLRVCGGQGSLSDRVDWPSRLLIWLTGDGHRNTRRRGLIRIQVNQFWKNWFTRPEGAGKTVTDRSGSTEAKRRGCSGLSGIRMGEGR